MEQRAQLAVPMLGDAALDRGLARLVQRRHKSQVGGNEPARLEAPRVAWPVTSLKLSFDFHPSDIMSLEGPAALPHQSHIQKREKSDE
jgi:hypothetical protein